MAESYAKYILFKFLQNCQSLSKVVPFYISTNNVWEFQFLYILTRNLILRIKKKIAILVSVVSHYKFNVHFPDN